MALSGLYARLCHAFLVSFFFYLFFNDHLENNYFRIDWTDFLNFGPITPKLTELICERLV